MDKRHGICYHTFRVVKTVDYEMLGKRIIERRRFLKIRQFSLAAEVGISKSFMANLESGRGKPSLDTLVAIAEALHTGCDWLLRDSLTIGPGSAYWMVDDQGDLFTHTFVVEEEPLSPVYEGEEEMKQEK